MQIRQAASEAQPELTPRPTLGRLKFVPIFDYLENLVCLYRRKSASFVLREGVCLTCAASKTIFNLCFEETIKSCVSILWPSPLFQV